MNVARSLVVLAGLVGALGTGCVARVHSHAYVAHRVVVWDEPPPLVYVDGVYVVQDSDVGIYYVDGYYWYESDGVWYRRTYYNDPWVSVNVSFVPVLVVHRDHHHYAHYHGTGKVYREPARPSKTAHHSTAKPSSGASASAEGSASVSDSRRTVEANGIDSKSRTEARADADNSDSSRRVEDAPASRKKSASTDRSNRSSTSRSPHTGDAKGGPSDSRVLEPRAADSERATQAAVPSDQAAVSRTKKKPVKTKRSTTKPRRSSR